MVMVGWPPTVARGIRVTQANLQVCWQLGGKCLTKYIAGLMFSIVKQEQWGRIAWSHAFHHDHHGETNCHHLGRHPEIQRIYQDWDHVLYFGLEKSFFSLPPISVWETKIKPQGSNPGWGPGKDWKIPASNFWKAKVSSWIRPWRTYRYL